MDMLIPNQKYSKQDIYRILSVPKEKQGGGWHTGYHVYNGQIYIFSNIGVPGRTGHNYDNHWTSDGFLWYGKPKTTVNQPLIQKMLSGKMPMHLFTRNNDRDPFKYEGRVIVKDAEAVSPVKIIWAVEQKLKMDIPASWNTLLENANKSLLANEKFVSPKQLHEYLIVKVTKNAVVIRRLSVKEASESTLTFEAYKKAIESFYLQNFIAPKGTLNDLVAIETAIVFLSPFLDWDNENKNIVLSETVGTVKTKIAVGHKEAVNDNPAERISRELRARRGQNKLRDNLFSLYAGKCCITQCEVKEILHACHLIPHAETGNNHSTNALLLRSDIHDLFDANLIGIEPKSFKISVSEALRSTEYYKYNGKTLLARNDHLLPNAEALEQRWGLFCKRNT